MYSDLLYLGKSPLHTIACNDDSVPLVCAPSLKQLSGEATLHHSRAGHDDTWTNIVKLIYVLQWEEHETHDCQ